jgi:hypothetical protein
VGLKGKAITLITIRRFDVAPCDTTSPRLGGKYVTSVKEIVKKEKQMGSFAIQPKKRKDWTKKNLSQNACELCELRTHFF